MTSLNKHQNLLAWRKSKGCTIDCEINLDELFETKEGRKKFDTKWKDFLASDPNNKAVITFQKNALRSDDDPSYGIAMAKAGKLKGTLKDNLKIPLFCVPPTRLSGPCSNVLNKFSLSNG